MVCLVPRPGDGTDGTFIKECIMSFQQGLSGLNAAARNLDVIGNNVANTNTVGFKQSHAQFADMFANSLAGSGSTQAGMGVSVAAVAA